MIELGGGIWIVQVVVDYLKLGIDWVILGLVVVKDFQLICWVLNDWGSVWIVIGVDGKDGMVVMEGWFSQLMVLMVILIGWLVEVGVVNFIVIDVVQDGMMVGFNLNLFGDLQVQFLIVNIIVFGGICNLVDIDVFK